MRRSKANLGIAEFKTRKQLPEVQQGPLSACRLHSDEVKIGRLPVNNSAISPEGSPNKSASLVVVE